MSRKSFLVVAALFLLIAAVWVFNPSKREDMRETSKQSSSQEVNRRAPAPETKREPSGPSQEQMDATARAMPCDDTVLTDLDLLRPPTEAELIRAGRLEEKLTPTWSADFDLITDPAGIRAQQQDNLAFGTAIQAWNNRLYEEALKLFTAHLESSPDSPWAAESALHIGRHYQFVGRKSEALEIYDKVVAASVANSEMYHKARLFRAIINIDFGKLEATTTAFAEIMKSDPDPTHRTFASYWLMQNELLKANAVLIRDCGQKALSHAAMVLGNPERAQTLSRLTAAGPDGFNAAELQATALKNGLETFPVQAADALEALPVPFVAHYNDRHYVTVESVTKDGVKLYDSRLESTTTIPRTSFQKSWSGFALLMKPPPQSEKIIPAQRLEEIIGGCGGAKTEPEELGQDDECPTKCLKLPGCDLNPVNMNFKVIDTPVWWEAPVGPSIYMTLLFNSQDSYNHYTPFGKKWAFEYASYLQLNPGWQVKVRDGDGKVDTFTPPDTGAPLSYPVTRVSPKGDFRVLIQTSHFDFTLTEQNGTIFRYGVPPAMIGGPNFIPPPGGQVPAQSSSVPLLLSITDRHGNVVTITHNANGAIVKVAHSAWSAGTWDLSYTTIGGSMSRVTQITDPFGRIATFGYDAAGNLNSQTDMGGLQYSYTYVTKNAIDNTLEAAGQTVAPQLFVASITVPTARTTQIITEPADGVESFSITPAQTAEGYNEFYRPPGQPMWTSYRVTVKGHLNQTTEYHFDGKAKRFIRDPIQMQRPPGKVNPLAGARLELGTALVGGKGAIDKTFLYSDPPTASDPPLLVSSSISDEYDQNLRMASKVPDGNGGVHYLQYNVEGKPTLIDANSQGGDSVTNIVYEANNKDIDTVKRAYDGVEKTLANYEYYTNRDMRTVTDVYGGTLTYVWYPNGLPWTITDSLTNDVFTFAYDTNLRPYTTSINETIIATTVYDAMGKGTLTMVFSPDGRSTSYEYDNLNRLTKELHSDGSFTAYQWACCYIEATRFGKQIGAVEKTLRRSVTAHDARSLPVSTTDTDGKITKYGYDIAGRFNKLTDSKNQVTEWKHNAAGQLMEKVYPDLSKETFTYVSPATAYGMGKIETFTNRREQTTSLTYEYDGLLNTVSKSNGEPGSFYEYDFWRRIDSITQDAGLGVTAGTHHLLHDYLGRLTSIDGPWDADTIGYVYNDAARIVTRTSPGGMTQTTSRDAYGRTASIANILGTFTHIYGNALPPNIEAGVGDPLSAIIHTGTNAGFNTAFTYYDEVFDRALATITSSKPGGASVAKHTYTYNLLGNVQTWKREAQLANPAGATPDNPTGGTLQYQSTVYYDQTDQLSSVVNYNVPLATPPVSGSAYHYLYDPAGNIASKQVETSGIGATMTTYGQNNLNQITGIGGSGGVKQVFVRGETDELATVKVKPSLATEWKNARMLDGNRFESDQSLATGANTLKIQAKDGSNNVSNYTYSLNLTAPTTTIPDYDDDGNMLSDGVRSYEWDSQSRLIKITWGGSPIKSTEYRYNALGQRSEQIEKTGTAETARYYYLYDGIHLLCRYTGGTAAGNIDRRYLSQGEQRKTGSVWASHYYTRDDLGSIREVMNSDGTLVARYDYDPYGKRQTQYLASTFVGGCDLGYTGHITQQSAVSGQGDVVLSLFRAYNPELGRWLSADPIGEEGGINLYGYVENDPVNNDDELGLQARGWWSRLLSNGFRGTSKGRALSPNMAAKRCGKAPVHPIGLIGPRSYGQSMNAMKFIKNGQKVPGTKGGGIFQNKEMKLPTETNTGSKISYREWDVCPKPAGAQNRGTERIVTGDDGRVYFTKDHYDSFIDITSFKMNW